MSEYRGAVTETSFGKDSSGNTIVSAIYTTLDFNLVSPNSHVLAHETGYAVNIFNNPSLGSKDTVTHNCQDPANRNTFQSKNAMDWQEHYNQAQKVYPVPQLMYIMFGLKY